MDDVEKQRGRACGPGGNTTPLRGLKPWDRAEVPGAFSVILAAEPDLQQLLGPLEEMCTVILHHETTDTSIVCQTSVVWFTA